MEQNSIANLAPRLTAKPCWPSKLERQNVKLALHIFDDSTSAALKISNKPRLERFKHQPAEFTDIIVMVWKIFNVIRPNTDVHLNDEFSKQLVLDDPRFGLITRIVNTLYTWRSLPGKQGKSTPQTFTSFKHTCEALPILVNHLTSQCGFSYVLTYFLQTDPLEHHFGLYRMMSGSNYHVSYGQILETGRRLKISTVLKLFTQEPSSKENNLGSFIKYFTPKEDVCDSHISLKATRYFYCNHWLRNSSIFDIYCRLLRASILEGLEITALSCLPRFTNY